MNLEINLECKYKRNSDKINQIESDTQPTSEK